MSQQTESNGRRRNLKNCMTPADREGLMIDIPSFPRVPSLGDVGKERGRNVTPRQMRALQGLYNLLLHGKEANRELKQLATGRSNGGAEHNPAVAVRSYVAGLLQPAAGRVVKAVKKFEQSVENATSTPFYAVIEALDSKSLIGEKKSPSDRKYAHHAKRLLGIHREELEAAFLEWRGARRLGKELVMAARDFSETLDSRESGMVVPEGSNVTNISAILTSAREALKCLAQGRVVVPKRSERAYAPCEVDAVSRSFAGAKGFFMDHMRNLDVVNDSLKADAGYLTRVRECIVGLREGLREDVRDDGTIYFQCLETKLSDHSRLLNDRIEAIRCELKEGIEDVKLGSLALRSNTNPAWTLNAATLAGEDHRQRVLLRNLCDVASHIHETIKLPRSMRDDILVQSAQDHPTIAFEKNWRTGLYRSMCWEIDGAVGLSFGSLHEPSPQKVEALKSYISALSNHTRHVMMRMPDPLVLPAIGRTGDSVQEQGAFALRATFTTFIEYLLAHQVIHDPAIRPGS
jgi:hypothetical protein